MKKILLIMIFNILTGGCAYTQHTSLVSEEFEPRIGNILITTVDIDENYTEIVIINSDGWSLNQSKKAIEKRAKKLGADAVIKLNCGNMASNMGVGTAVGVGGSVGTGIYTSGGSPNCTGIAVKYMNKGGAHFK